MVDSVSEEFEQQIYEAAVVPDHWPHVLDQLARGTGSVGSVLFGRTDTWSRWIASPPIRPLMERFITEGWVERNSRANNGFAKGLALQPRFVTEADLYDGDEYEHDPLYLEYFRPSGLGWSAGTAFLLPHGDALTLSVERAHALGPMPSASLAFLDAFRPHLARSAMMAARLAFERARTAVDTLSMLGLPAVALASDGRVLIGNGDFETERSLWSTRGRDRIALFDRRADRLLSETLGTIRSPAGIRSIPLFSRKDDGRAVLHVVPIRRSAHDIFGNAAAIAVLTKPSTAPAGSVTLLQALFDFTPAEADVAARIASGLTTAEIAAADAKSELTVRRQLKSVLQKTGCRRQVDLARMLARLIPPAL